MTDNPTRPSADTPKCETCGKAASNALHFPHVSGHDCFAANHSVKEHHAFVPADHPAVETVEPLSDGQIEGIRQWGNVGEDNRINRLLADNAALRKRVHDAEVCARLADEKNAALMDVRVEAEKRIKELEGELSQRNAAIELAAEDEVFFTMYNEKDWSGPPRPCVYVNDIFVYAADAESFGWDVAPELLALYRSGGWASLVEWAAQRRNMRPLPKREAALDERKQSAERIRTLEQKLTAAEDRATTAEARARRAASDREDARRALTAAEKELDAREVGPTEYDLLEEKMLALQSSLKAAEVKIAALERMLPCDHRAADYERRDGTCLACDGLAALRAEVEQLRGERDAK